MPAAFADIVIPGVNGGADTVIKTPGDDGPYRPDFSAAGAKAAEYEKRYDAIIDFFMHTSSYSLSIGTVRFDEAAGKIAIGFVDGVTDAKIEAFIKQFGGTAQDYIFSDGTIVPQGGDVAVEAGASEAAWAKAPYADKALNKLKNTGLVVRYKIYRNTLTEMTFDVRNRRKEAIVIEGGFYLERKAESGWQRLSAELKRLYGGGGAVEVPAGIDGAAQTVTIGTKLANGEYRIVADAALKKSPQKTYPISANFTVADYGMASYDEEGWVPTYFSDDELKAAQTYEVQTEHPVYAPGAQSISVIIYNENRKSIMTYGSVHWLERKSESGWQHYFIPNMIFPSDGYEIPARNREAQSVNIANLPPLEAGEYRLVKQLHFNDEVREKGSFNTAAYFTVAEGGYDPAYMSGYTPLEQLPATYTEQNAIADEVLFVDASGALHNGDRLLTLLEKATTRLESKIRVFRYNDAGEPVITDVTFKSPYHIELKQDGTRTSAKDKWVELDYQRLLVRQIDGKDALVIANQDIDGNITAEWVILHDITPLGAKNVNDYLKSINR